MIKHCFICPTAFINDPYIGGRSDFLLALSHLIDDEATNEYAQAVKQFKTTWKQVILDNGLFENHSPEGSESLVQKAMKIGADIVFAPDFLYQREATVKAFDEFFEISTKLGAQFKFGYVVQADNRKDYLEAFEQANLDPRIDLIGLSILSVPKSFEEVTKTSDITVNRIECIKQIDEFVIDPIKPCHMLGLGESLLDLAEAKNYPWIYSNDSSSAFQTGKHLKKYEHLNVPGGKVHEKVVFEQTSITGEQAGYIVDNINTIKNLLADKEENLFNSEDTILR